MSLVVDCQRYIFVKEINSYHQVLHKHVLLDFELIDLVVHLN